LVPYKNVNSDDEEYEQGNPNLKAAESTNFDLMIEHYLKNVGIISAGAFYKRIDNWFYTYRNDSFTDINYPGVSAFEYSQTRNGNVAEVYGAEFALQYKLNFLPSFLRNLNFYGNYTITDSKADGVEGRGKVALSGAVKNMFNTSLAYETSKVTARISLNYSDAYVDEFGSEASEDIYYDEQLFLDVNASYKLTEGLLLFGEAKNLTNQELRYYQGNSRMTRQAEFYDVNWNLGLRYNF
jgi:TonB-dependent receptor